MGGYNALMGGIESGLDLSGGRIEGQRSSCRVAIHMQLEGAACRSGIHQANAGTQRIERAGDLGSRAFDLLGKTKPDADLVALHQFRQGQRAATDGAVELAVGEIDECSNLHLFTRPRVNLWTCPLSVRSVGRSQRSRR
jgi:hypothetical protein